MTPPNPSTLVKVVQPVDIEIGDNYSLDAFGRLRISEPHTVFESKLIFDNSPLFWDDQEVSGSGTTSTHSVNTASIVMAVGTAVGKRVRQTFIRPNYQPGKSQLILMSGNLCVSGGGLGITSACGLFDDNNGIFFQAKDNDINVVIRSKTTGSPVDDSVSQVNWNLDTLDGLGPSGHRVDFTKSQIFMLDYEWLGVGRVRLALVLNGIPVYCHEFDNSNKLTGVYMSTPNLPLRYQIENDGTGIASSMRQICSTIIFEGGRTEIGETRWASTAGAALVTDTENVIYALVGIRLKSSHIGHTIEIQNIATQIQTASEFIEWSLLFNPTVAGSFIYGDQTNSGVQISLGATANTVTNGIAILGGFDQTGNQASGGGGSANEINNALLLGSAIDGTLDTMVLCVRPTGGAAAMSVEGGIAWRELT